MIFEFSLRLLPAPRKKIKVHGIEWEDSRSICFSWHDMFEVHLSPLLTFFFLSFSLQH